MPTTPKIIARMLHVKANSSCYQAKQFVCRLLSEEVLTILNSEKTEFENKTIQKFIYCTHRDLVFYSSEALSVLNMERVLVA